MAGALSGRRRPSRRARILPGLVGIAPALLGCHPAPDPGASGAPVSWTARKPANRSPLGDPRDDPAAYLSARAIIDAKSSWNEGYAQLIRLAAAESSPQAGRASDLFPNEPNGAPGGSLPNEPNGAAGRFLPNEPNGPPVRPLPNEPKEAREPTSPNEPNGVADGLLADLLGTTILDAQDELTRAGSALRGHSASVELLDTWTQAPPWPPEFVSQLIRRRMRRGDDPGPWVGALAAQIAPEPASRDWLLASWTRPRRPVDGALLAEIAAADGGRLGREPRFRAWLRGEWRAWARQKYRLVERQGREAPR